MKRLSLLMLITLFSTHSYASCSPETIDLTGTQTHFKATCTWQDETANHVNLMIKGEPKVQGGGFTANCNLDPAKADRIAGFSLYGDVPININVINISVDNVPLELGSIRFFVNSTRDAAFDAGDKLVCDINKIEK